MTISINGQTYKVPKDLIIVKDKEDIKEIYVDMLEMLNLQKIPFHKGDFGITVLLSGSKVVRLNVEDNKVVINGDALDLTEGDYTYNKQKLYLTGEMYRELFDQAITYHPEEKIKFEAYDTGDFKIPKDLTLGEYLNMSSEERQNLTVKNNYSPQIHKSQVTMVPGDELNPIIKDAYNEVVFSFDLYRQFQFYNWHLGIEDSDGLSGYLLCSNANTILRQFERMKVIREIADIKEFTAKDIEYINRINTLYNAMDFTRIKLLGPAIESYMDKLKPLEPGKDVYRSTAEETLEQFNKTFKVEKVDRLQTPAWAEFDSYYVTLKNVPYIGQEETLLDMVDQVLDVIPEGVQNAIEWCENYKDAEEIIIAAYPEWKEYLPGLLMEEALKELADNLKNGPLEKPVTVLEKVKIIKIYDGFNLFRDALNLVTESDNNLFADFKNSRVESLSNILKEVVNPAEIIKSGFELGNESMVSLGCTLGLELFIAQQVLSKIEEWGRLVNGLILMSMDTDSMDDVYRGRITMEQYLDGE